MHRVATLAALSLCLLCLAARQPGHPVYWDHAYPANSTLANVLWDNLGSDWTGANHFLENETPDPSAFGPQVLMLNYSSYDSAYVAKMKGLISKRIPGANLTDYWGGNARELSEALAGQHLVVVTYAAKGDPKLVRAMGKVLRQYIQQGGAVLFSGTDQFGVLQQYGLFDLEFGYFCSGVQVDEEAVEHPTLLGTPNVFALSNYVYPLDVSDPNFVVLAETRGYPTIGFKPLGEGKVVYLGMEYYYDESISSQILENTVRWLCPVKSETAVQDRFAENTVTQARSGRRTEERLFAGSGGAPTAQPGSRVPLFSLKLYPNPYTVKATVDINLEKPAPVIVEMTNEAGALVSLLLPYRLLNQGTYRLELPNLPPGIYFVKCQVGDQTSVRKVVKVAEP
ncbi:MAG: T9SS type A sorting domain-containing protein [Saprospiraceae bacterium]